MSRTVARLAVVVLLALVGASCSEQEGDGEEVREFLDATRVEPHRFVYTETVPDGTTTVVQGLVEDDLRYRALLNIDGERVMERVVADDDVAVRLHDPEQLGAFIDRAAVDLVDTDTSLDGITVFEALQARRWVVDPGGAPPLLLSLENRTEGGLDPIEDARRFLDRAREVTFILADSGGLVEYNPNSVSPTYRRDEDPFPAPEEGSDVVRYDLVQPPFPRSLDPNDPFVPGTDQFRKLAIYVEDGVVIRVSEDIGLAPTVLDRFETYMVQLVNEQAPPAIREDFRSTVDSLEGDELGLFLLEALNTVRDLTGDPRVRFRSATYELIDLGSDEIEVEMPTDDVIEADLAVLLSIGVKPAVDPDAASDDDEEDLEPIGLDADAAGRGTSGTSGTAPDAPAGPGAGDT